MSDETDETDEQRAWRKAMSQPVTRDEFVRAMMTIQAILLSHSAHDAMQLIGDDEAIRKSGERVTAGNLSIGDLMRKFVNQWTGGNV